MLLGATDGQIRLIERFAGCFTDYRMPEKDRPAGTPLQGLHLAHPQELEPGAPPRRQGAIDRRRTQPALCCDLAGP